MSEQTEREDYNEAAREYHEGREREEMDRPIFTQRDVDAAVQGEREAICRYADADDFRPDLPIDRKYPELGAWSRGVLAVTEYIRSRGPAPAVDVLTDALRKHDRLWCEALVSTGDLRVIEKVTKYVVERRPESAAALVSPTTSPAVDVMAVVREYVEAYDDYQEAINFKKTCRNDESVTVAADRRIKAGLALRALVDGKGEAKENER